MHRYRKLEIRFVGLIVLAHLSASPSASAQNVVWTRQLGSAAFDASRAVSTDAMGNVFISGETDGSLNGPNAGSSDAFLSKYDAAGNVVWTRQFGTSNSDGSYGVSADGLGNAYVTGYIDAGNIAPPNPAAFDAFVGKYDGSGNLLWMHQLGTSDVDASFGVSADGLGNVYISGNTGGSLGGPNAGGRDAFVSKYNATGANIWTHQFGTSADDLSFGVSADQLGNVFLAGYTDGNLGGPNAGGADAFVTKYDSAGTLVWNRQLGTSSYDVSFGVSADDAGNVYITGYTAGSLGGPNTGDDDAFLAKYDGAGNLLWIRQLGTSVLDDGKGISTDGHGNVYISGYSAGAVGPSPEGNYSYPFVSKYDSSGQLLWTEQLAGNGLESAWAISADGMGHVYISGFARGSSGDSDAFVAKITAVPEPDALGAMIICVGILYQRRLRRRRSA